MKKMASKGINMQFYEQIAAMQQAQAAERERLRQRGRKTTRTLLILVGILLVFCFFILPAINGDAAPLVASKFIPDGKTAALHIDITPPALPTEQIDVQKVVPEDVQTFFLETKRTVRRFVRAVPGFIASLQSP